LLCLAIASSVHAQDVPERDDATGRIRARLQRDSVRSVEEQTRILEEAAREAAKWSIGQPHLRNAALVSSAGAVPPGTWINVGPAAGTQVSPLTQPASDSGRMRKIVPHPTDPNVLYVATSGGGVWKTFDAQAAITTTTGPHWTSITSGIGSQSVGAFALDPNSPDTLFLGLGDPFDVETPGFYTSLDGGATWQGPVNLTGTLGTATSVRDIVVDPSGTSAVVVATNAGLFRQLEGGPWTYKDLGASASGNCWSVAWVASMNWLATCGNQVFASADNGVSWAPSNNNLPTASLGRLTLAAAYSDRANPATAYVYLLAATANGGDQYDVFLSTNGGTSWSALGMNSTNICITPGHSGCPLNATQDQPDLNVLHDQAWYNQAIIVDPRDHGKVFVGGNVAMIRSGDAGQSWYVMTDWLPGSPLCSQCGSLPYVHADWHAMAISYSQTALPSYCGVFPNGTATTVPAGTPCYFAGTDGGLFRSSDVFTRVPDSANSSGTVPHFEGKIGRGLVTHLAYSIATDLHDATNTTMIGGLQDNGTRLRINGSTTFNQVIGADGFAVGIGISNSNAAPTACKGHWGSLLLGTIYGVIYSSIDCGASFASAMAGICKPQPQFLNPAGGCNVDYGSNFFMKLTSDQADATGLSFITVINNSACDPSQASCSQAYGTNSVYATHDGAASTGGWTKANGTIHLAGGGTATNFASSLYSVSANPLHAGQWAVNDSSHVHVTLDSGANWTQSTALQGSVRGVAFEGATGGVIWASTRGSGSANYVQRSADGGTSWVDKSGDLPKVPANVVAVDPNDANTIYLGTEIGLYVSKNGGQNWTRYGGGSLPLVSVTEINVALNSSAIRISTFGRGFWELYPNANAPTGVYGNGDFDRNQIIDGFDLIREAAVLGLSAADPGYDPTGNLTGATNVIDAADFNALVAKMGGRP
jgi:photosystem II stability/assembly factor-like uncharacterized protein